MKKLSTVLGLTIALLITACGGGGDLVGTWKQDTSGLGEMEKALAEGVGASITFESGGKGTMNAMGMAIPMEWKVEGDELVMTMEMLGQKDTKRNKFSVSGDTLTMIEEEDGQKKESKLVRQK